MSTLCPPDHRHGQTGTCYLGHRCRCTPCREAHTRRAAEARKLIAYGRWDRGRMDPAPIAAHVRHLMEFGYSYERIAAAAGINENTPYFLAHDRLKFVFGRVGNAILAVRPNIADLDSRTVIPSRGARRRLQALAVRGWSIQALADHAGHTRTALSHVLWGTRTAVGMHRSIADLYDRLWDVSPPATPHTRRNIARALELGWLPPLAWDDIDADPTPPDPTSDEDHDSEPVIDVIAIDLVVERTETTPLTREERRIATDRLTRMTDPQTGRPYTAERIAHLVGVDPKTIERDRAHLKALAA